MNRLLLPILSLLFFSPVFARYPEDSVKVMIDMIRQMDSIESTLHYKTGTIALGNGIATINVPKGFKFLEAAEAKYVLEDVWGNLKGQAPLGMLFPESGGATNPEGYAFIVEYESIGYVKDNDADKIDYDDLLKDMKKGSVKDNEERMKMGLQTMELQGWASKPFYDKERKILHWAKEYKVQGAEVNTLNYDVRVLGRKGVLILQAISSIDDLDSVNKNINNVLSMVSFNPGNTYSDFDSKTDEIAAWTIGGLVAGKVLAKVGFFAIILKYLKFIIIGLGAAGGGIWRFISGRKKKEEEFVYQTQSLPQQHADQTSAQ